MTDIFHHWKENKFIVVSPCLTDDQAKMVILTDTKFWANHWLALTTWCSQHGAVNTGMTVTFPDEKTLSIFCLKWS